MGVAGASPVWGELCRQGLSARLVVFAFFRSSQCSLGYTDGWVFYLLMLVGINLIHVSLLSGLLTARHRNTADTCILDRCPSTTAFTCSSGRGGPLGLPCRPRGMPSCTSSRSDVPPAGGSLPGLGEPAVTAGEGSPFSGVVQDGGAAVLKIHAGPALRRSSQADA